MKKTLAIITIILCVLSFGVVYATSTSEAIQSFGTTQDTISELTGTTNNNSNNNAIDNKKNNNNNETQNTVKKPKDSNETDKKQSTTATNGIAENVAKEKKTLEDYQIAYNSDSYGLTAYILSRIRIYSIPFCFLGIAISAIYQYVLGIRKLDTRDKGFAIMISIITIFVIAQVLPLIFAIVVKGWN